MKKLIVILGSNGVGKSTAAKAFLERNERCAFVDADWCRTMNPFLLTPATRKAVTENIYCLFKNYRDVPWKQTEGAASWMEEMWNARKEG